MVDRKNKYRIGVLWLTAWVGVMGIATGQKLEAPLSKPSIDTAALGKWPGVISAFASPYGRYTGYWIRQPETGKLRLVIQDSSESWKEEYTEAGDCFFSGDERQAVIWLGDSLHFIDLERKVESRIMEIRSMKRSRSPLQEWIAYTEKRGDGELVLNNLISGKERRLGKVLDYWFDREAKYLLLKIRVEENGRDREELRFVELTGQTDRRIWMGQPDQSIGELWFGQSGQLIGFAVTKRSDGHLVKGLWAYSLEKEQAELVVEEGEPRLTAGIGIGRDEKFSQNGKWLFFTAVPPKTSTPSSTPPSPDAVMVDIWGSKDKWVQPDQLVREGLITSSQPVAMRNDVSPLTVAVEVGGKRLSVLTRGTERLETPAAEVTGDDVVISEPETGSPNPLGGISSFRRSYRIISLATRDQRVLRRDAEGLTNFRFSPDAKWVIYFDGLTGHYFSWEIRTGRLHNITSRLSTSMFIPDEGDVPYFRPAGAPAGWWTQGGETRVLLYDRNDLWGLDPANRLLPMNITKGLGAAHGLELRLLRNPALPEKLRYLAGDTLMFVGFNRQTKYNGFVRQVLGSVQKPEVLTMGPYLYYRPGFDEPPVRAEQSSCWIVKRQSATEAPNFFMTTDWKRFRAVSHQAPHVGYNWLTAELVRWKQLDGTFDEGILYKPENFDQKKRYPVIIHYYEQLSDRLYEFLNPEFTENDLNIPWMVSQGFLVFTPDIHYRLASKSGKTAGEWAYNSVIAAARYLVSLPYVNPKKLGLQGHSFGACETNYIITHSHLFAAAVEFAGITDLVSYYLSLNLGTMPIEHGDLTSFVETDQVRMGATLWQRPELYLRWSTVLRADQVTTPLLMVHNKKDQVIPWRQGIEFYLALRRLRKRAWMLQYDDGSHSVFGKEARDFTIRMTQFFNYYLKDEFPPKWMTEGVPARLKGIESGYELDTSGRVP